MSLLTGLPPEERWAAWRLASPEGSMVAGGKAAAAIVEALGAPTLARVAGRVEPALDRAYGLIARNRRLLGHLVPDGPGPRRYP